MNVLLATVLVVVAFVLLLMLALLIVSIVEAILTERRRRQQLADRLLCEARMQRLTDQATGQMLDVAREELLRQAVARSRHRPTGDSSSGSPIRVQQVWDDDGHE